MAQSTAGALKALDRAGASRLVGGWSAAAAYERIERGEERLQLLRRRPAQVLEVVGVDGAHERRRVVEVAALRARVVEPGG